MTLYEALQKLQPTGLHLECGSATFDVGGKTLAIGPDLHGTVTQDGDKYRIDFDENAPTLKIGWGVSVPIRLEVSPEGVDAIGRKFGVVKRQRLIMQDLPE